MRTSPPLAVDPDDLAILREWSLTGGSTVVRRARIVLLSGDGLGPTAVAAEIGCSKQTVITWRERYRADGLKGLADAPRSGRPVSVDPVAVITRTLTSPPPRLRAVRWSSRLLAAELGISNVAVANIWRAWGVAPTAGGQVRLATEPPLHPPAGRVAAACVGRDLALVALIDRGAVAPVVAPRDRPRLGDRLDRLDLGDGNADPLPVLDGLCTDGMRLLVDSVAPEVARWASRRGVAVHVVPPELSWLRLIRVLVVLIGETRPGAVSVGRLRTALAEHVPGRPFHWRDPDAVANKVQ